MARFHVRKEVVDGWEVEAPNAASARDYINSPYPELVREGNAYIVEHHSRDRLTVSPLNESVQETLQADDNE